MPCIFLSIEIQIETLWQHKKPTETAGCPVLMRRNEAAIRDARVVKPVVGIPRNWRGQLAASRIQSRVRLVRCSTLSKPAAPRAPHWRYARAVEERCKYMLEAIRKSPLAVPQRDLTVGCGSGHHVLAPLLSNPKKSTPDIVCW